MNILMVLSSSIYPPDRRVEREARDLIADGHQVYLLARRGKGQTRAEMVDGVHVLRTTVPLQGLGPLSGLVYFGVQRYTIAAVIWRLCRRYAIDALHVHDLPYAFATTMVAKLTGRTVLFDMHEHYTVMLEQAYDTADYRRYKFLTKFQLAPLHLEERFVCRTVDQLVVVADEQLPRVKQLGAAPEKTLVITNTEDPEDFADQPLDASITGAYADRFVILYTGGFSAHRGLDIAIKSMLHLKQTLPNALLVLVGSGPIQAELEALTHSLQLTEHVQFVPFQPFNKLPSYVAGCAVGLIPHLSTPHIETTMPNKIFQYMMMGKPVVSSNVTPLVRVIGETGCGVTYQHDDPHALANAVLALRSPEARLVCGEKGRQATRERYNWRHTVRPLLQFYRERAAALDQ